MVVDYGGIQAIDEVSLQIGGDGVRGLIGPNGAGKTTLVDVICGLRRPDRGRVSYDGRDITTRTVVWRARHGIRRTFQRTHWLAI